MIKAVMDKWIDFSNYDSVQHVTYFRSLNDTSIYVTEK